MTKIIFFYTPFKCHYRNEKFTLYPKECKIFLWFKILAILKLNYPTIQYWNIDSTFTSSYIWHFIKVYGPFEFYLVGQCLPGCVLYGGTSVAQFREKTNGVCFVLVLDSQILLFLLAMVLLQKN